MEAPKTFTDFMIHCMEGQENVEQAMLIVRRSDGSFGYKALNQEVMDSLGMLRFCSMSIEDDTIKMWRNEIGGE